LAAARCQAFQRNRERGRRVPTGFHPQKKGRKERGRVRGLESLYTKYKVRIRSVLIKESEESEKIENHNCKRRNPRNTLFFICKTVFLMDKKLE
jgi:hypothetical protein